MICGHCGCNGFVKYNSTKKVESTENNNCRRVVRTIENWICEKCGYLHAVETKITSTIIQEVVN